MKLLLNRSLHLKFICSGKILKCSDKGTQITKVTLSVIWAAQVMFNFCLSVISKGFQSAAVLKIRPSPPSFEGFGLDIHSYLFRQFTKFTKIAYIDITLT